MLPLAWQGEVVPPAASKGKGKGNQKDKEAGWMQPRLGGCYKSGKDYRPWLVPKDTHRNPLTTVIKGSLGGETSVLRTFRMSGKELVKERVSKERVSQRKS